MRSFADLFRGREDAYGVYGDITSSLPTDRGKRAGNARTVKEGVLPEHWPELWARHLVGKARLGIAPVLPDNSCWWFCIDVDFYDNPSMYADIANRIKETALPLVMTLSKSGGLHLWCFFSAPVPAGKAREIAKTYLKKLKLGEEHIDIFPAQAKVDVDSAGNWVNIPYFGDTCPGLDADGNEKLSLEEFLIYANERVQDIADATAKAKKNPQTKKSGAPPCIDHAAKEGIPDGYRNNFLTHYGIYALKAFPDDWKEKLQDFNEQHAEPPYTKHELGPIIKSVGSRKYTGYLCSKVDSLFCDKKECRLREFGIGGGADLEGQIIIDRIETIDGKEPI